jgi:hypothetical protein
MASLLAQSSRSTAVPVKRAGQRQTLANRPASSRWWSGRSIRQLLPPALNKGAIAPPENYPQTRALASDFQARVKFQRLFAMFSGQCGIRL